MSWVDSSKARHVDPLLRKCYNEIVGNNFRDKR